MTWGEFRELLMGKFFPVSARHAKARKFLELKQGNMTVLEYVAKFTELARFGEDYVATDMAKVWKFEDSRKLSIRGKILGFLLQDMDSMVRTALGTSEKWKEINLLLVWERGRRLMLLECLGMGPQLLGLRPDQGFYPVRTADMFSLPSARTCEAGLTSEERIPGFWDSADIVCSFSPQCGSEGLVSVLGCCIGAFCYTDRLERLEYGSRSRTGFMGRDIRVLGACLRHHTTD